MIDTHSHLYDNAFNGDRRQVVERAVAAGVKQVILANVDITTIEPMRLIATQYPDFCLMVMGLQPESVKEDYPAQLAAIAEELDRGSYCGIGEIGLDFYWDATYRAEQIDAFETQLQWAEFMDLPVVVHARKAYAETLTSLQKFKNVRGVLHCFSGGIEEARKAVEMGLYLGVGGTITYKNSRLPDIIRTIGLNHLLLETDAPYLPPMPHRGQRNEPQYMRLVVEKLSEIFNSAPEEIDRITTQNAKHLFQTHNAVE